MFKNSRILLAVVAIAICVALFINAATVFRKGSELHEQNEALRTNIAVIEAQNLKLRSCSTPTPYPQPNPNDPICGDPSAIKSPTPEVHRHGK